MRAFRVTSFDQPPQVEEIPVPQPQAGQIRLKIESCGVNFADTLMTTGKYQDTPELPFTMGMEVCGIVDELGAGVTSPAVGSRVVVYCGSGGMADYGVFAADRCLPVPDGMPPETAAGFMIAYGTSHLALKRRARLQAGETLVVTGAGGGVGQTAIEIGKLMGARVIAIARGERKLAAAKAAGADVLIDASEDLTARLRAEGGVDVLYDAVGGDAFGKILRAMNREGRMLVIGFASGTVPPIPANHLLVKNVDVMGFYWGGYVKFNPEAMDESLKELMQYFAEGRLHPHINHVVPLYDAPEALDLLTSRRSTGKVVVNP
ncbi:NADPH:quinone oxidoreductase family protein [Marivivens aquimaris]|uniref:NADPH:quinone oxidoreductase family protein n=1 Tax=Marivivens aquimaris TaxID=2774876 RepID=UPI00187F3E33|nr:NADPH:quinone oxidoreductase family protein [Marivivens aquimaris]